MTTPPRRLARAGLIAVGLFLLLIAGLLFTQPGRVAVRVLLILPELFPSAPARPLLWLTSPPRHEECSYQSTIGQVDCELYLPTTNGRHAAVVLYTGAYGMRREPSFVQVAEALARSGAVVLVPESTTLRSGDILPEEADELLVAVADLRQRPDVNPRRVGIFGFSVGGSVALLAAEKPKGREQLAFLNIFGAYYDARQLVQEVMSHQIMADGQLVSWEPSETASYTAARQVIVALPEFQDRDILWRAFLDQQPEAQGELDQLSPAGCTVRDLLGHPSWEQADALIGALPTSSLERLAAISPSTGIGQLQAHLYVMHSRVDGYIPFTQARRLAAEAPPETLRSYAEFDLFGHVMPDRRLAPLAFASELIELARHAWVVGQEFL